ncbi:hypothetical protein JOF56_009187 [Kibdelosporangium banguiense]|uniref:Uncharacterized protein n=1 Tax=Kibdelosporangium banguiense TaxID=1365924 RepID=A0ABS4TWM3_9PSEU|nr:hypothetical protein [Kibdelosporangium banguiense]MBP2328802.1 hypothetical protein [Kibdelosporangium banguiense]
MKEFTAVLHSQVDDAKQAMTAARQARHDYEVHLHGARIRDLLDVPAEHGIDTGDWVDRTMLDDAMLGA